MKNETIDICAEAIIAGMTVLCTGGISYACVVAEWDIGAILTTTLGGLVVIWKILKFVWEKFVGSVSLQKDIKDIKTKISDIDERVRDIEKR